MQLDVRVRHLARAGRRAEVADAVELVAEAGAVDGDGVVRLLHAHAVGVDEAAEHVGGEAGALLVREEGDGERAARGDAGSGEALDHREPAEHAEVAVVQASGAHGVDVRAGHHRRARLAPGAHADHVADGVDANVEVEVAHPPDHEVAPLPVVIRERQARTPATVEPTDLAQLVQAGDEPIDIDPEVADCGGDEHRLHGRTALYERSIDCGRVGPATDGEQARRTAAGPRSTCRRAYATSALRCR